MLTDTVACANRSVLRPHERKMAHCAAVPDGPGTTLLTVVEASLAMKFRQRFTPGVRTAKDSASASRISRAIATIAITTDGLMDLSSSPTELNSVIFGMIAQKSTTMRPPDSAALTFASAEGPALLKLGRKDGETTVNLAVRSPEAAAKAGVLPKAGQVKLLISNMSDAEAVMTIDKRTIKAGAGVGMKGPDGPIVELAPGKYKFSIKTAGNTTLRIFRPGIASSSCRKS